MVGGPSLPAVAGEAGFSVGIAVGTEAAWAVGVVELGATGEGEGGVTCEGLTAVLAGGGGGGGGTGVFFSLSKIGLVKTG